MSSVFQKNFKKEVSRVFQECFNEVLFCNFVLALISSQLLEQKEGLFWMGGGAGLSLPSTHPGRSALNYTKTLVLVNCESLQERRVKMCEICLKKSTDHLKYQNWFRMDENLVNERNTRKVNKCSKQKYHSVQCK